MMPSSARRAQAHKEQLSLLEIDVGEAAALAETHVKETLHRYGYAIPPRVLSLVVRGAITSYLQTMRARERARGR